MGVGRYEEGGPRRWYRFNASVLIQEDRRWDEALSEDKVEAARSSWLHEKEA
jgi:hypothetical protein